jgi:hypothetical protein
MGAMGMEKFFAVSHGNTLKPRLAFNQLSDMNRIWPIWKWDERSLKIARGIQGLPQLIDDDF